MSYCSLPVPKCIQFFLIRLSAVTSFLSYITKCRILFRNSSVKLATTCITVMFKKMYYLVRVLIYIKQKIKREYQKWISRTEKTPVYHTSAITRPCIFKRFCNSCVIISYRKIFLESFNEFLLFLFVWRCRYLKIKQHLFLIIFISTKTKLTSVVNMINVLF